MKKILFFLFCFFFIGFVVQAKEYDFYFYPNGGKVTTNNYELSDYGYLSYNGNFYASYNEKSTIKKINSIKGVSFQLEKSGTTLVNGKEWYTQVNGKTYFFNSSKTYKMQDVLKVMDIDDDFYSFDVYANWNDKKKTSGVDVSSGKSSSSVTSTKKATSFSISASKSSIAVGDSVTLKTSFKPSESAKESVAWSSSNTKIATVSSSGKVVGVGVGTVKITGKSKNGLKASISLQVIKDSTPSHYVIIQYNTNEGSFLKKHDSDYKIVKNFLYYKNGSKNISKIGYNQKLPHYGLFDYNNPDRINISRDGYIIKKGAEWNTKADGTGKSYSQEKVYQSKDFCDASKSNCTIILYANWKKDKNVHRVTIYYHANGGVIQNGLSTIKLKSGYVYQNNKKIQTIIDYGDSLSSSGLNNYNNSNLFSILKTNYVPEYSTEWNTKADGSGKSYSQARVYKASDFCDASKKDCSVTLYVNWKKQISSNYHLGDVALYSSNNYFVVPNEGNAKGASGMTVAGDYYVVAKRSSDDMSSVLYAIDINTKKIVRKLKKNNYWGHANGITYNSKTKEIYVTMTANRSCKIFPYSNLKANSFDFQSVKQVVMMTNDKKQNPTGLAYDSTNDLIYADGGGWKIHVYRSNLSSYQYSFSKKVRDATQDIGAYNGKVLVIRTNFSGNYLGRTDGKVNLSSVRNAIDVYRASDGAYLGTYIIQSNGELESVSYNPKNRTFTFYVNASKEARIYEANLPGIDKL